MIAVDTNLLVYSHREDSPWHDAAMRVLTELAEGPAAWAIPWPCVHEFLAIVTHPKIYRPPTPMPIALDAMRAWTRSSSLRLLGESPDHLDRLAHLALAAKANGPMVHDARIAALCLSHGVRQFWSADRDFSRFPQLKIRNPLVA
ncbi:MAG: TA system VapC family ribonuclease toxin [bacterium]